ncbi:hypothetical protein [Streptomyces sp. NRRL S-337]|uniref:hypothetical protein n=1 Tax=Streptomyces sp. NRRL S-337 TaxID=1463900 RepID=UPI0004C568CB|nr:hypothetical protein [Streptomyces sp. NRRL S-337]
MDRTHGHPATTAPLAALLTTAAAVIDANPHMQPDAVIGPRFAEGLLTLTARRFTAPAREQARTAARAARTAAFIVHTARRDGVTPTTLDAAATRADAAVRTASLAARQLAEVEQAAATTVDAALAALGPLPASTTRAQLSAAMRAAATAPALTGAAR